MTARIWIQLDKPPKALKAEAERLSFRNEQCLLANRLLQRLMGADCQMEFEWSESKCMYMYGHRVGSYEYLRDDGKWLNLSYLGRPLDETPQQWHERNK